MDISAHSLAQQCDQAREMPDGSWRMVCPLHGGRRDGLKITEKDGKVLMHCFGGCTYEDLAAHFDLKTSESPTPKKKRFNHERRRVQNAIEQHKATGKTPEPWEWLEGLSAPPHAAALCDIWKGVRSETSFSWADPGLMPLIEAMHKQSEAKALLLESMRIDKMSNKERDELLARIETRARVHGQILAATAWDAINPEDVTWLWYPYIPANKITFVGGDPGLGKTWLLLILTQAMTNGLPLPAPEQTWKPSSLAPGAVIYLNHEDGLADTLIARADALGIDRSKVHHVYGIPDPEYPDEYIPFDFSHLDYLDKLIQTLECKLLIVDPIQAYLGSKIDMHRANEVRPLMMRLKWLAERRQCTIVMSQHLSKGSVGGPALYRALGSVDFSAACRSQLVVSEDPDDENRRVLAQSKSSLARKGESLMFSIQEDQFRWHGPSPYDATELSRIKIGHKAVRVRDAREWLRDMLSRGPVASETIKDLAETQGIKLRTLLRAKSKLNVLSTKQSTGWFWHLPEPNTEWTPYRDDENIPF